MDAHAATRVTTASGGRQGRVDHPAAAPWDGRDEPIRHVPFDEISRLLDNLSSLGLDPVAVCRGSGLRHEMLRPSAGRVPVAVLVRVFACAERLGGDPYVGLHAAAHRPLSHVIALIAASQPTLRRALEHVCRFQSLLLGAEGLSCRIDDAATRVILKRSRMPAVLRHVSEYYMVTVARELERLAGPAARPLEVRLCHAAAGSTAEYERAFGCRVQFRRDEAMLCLSPRAAEAPLPGASPHVAALLVRLAAEQLAAMPQQTLNERVADAIRAALAGAGDTACPRIARGLGMSVRTLQRRLGDAGLTFRGVRDGVRRDLAMALSDGAAAHSPRVTDLALALGFADSATLCRAFKRWTGTSPALYRGVRGHRAGRRPRRPPAP
jgi:AraC-like DNA-binding protein